MQTLSNLVAILALVAAPILAFGADKLERTVKLMAATVEGTTEYIIVVPAEGGPSSRLVLTGDAKRKYVSLLNGRGELFNITIKPGGGDGNDLCTAVVPFDGPKGLKSPRAWLFDGRGEQKLGQQTIATVKLKRFGQTQEVLIPTRPISGGKPGPDPVLVEKIKPLNSGDCVEVEIQPATRGMATLLDIDVYREPQLGEFVKLDTIKEGGKSLPGVVMNVDDTPQTLALPAAAPGAPLTPGQSAAAAFVRKLKPGSYVRYTARDTAAGHSTLRDLRIDGVMQAVGARTFEFQSTFVRVLWYPYGADVDVYFYPRSGRPEDQVLEKGINWAVNSATEANRIGLNDERVKQLKAVLNNRLEGMDSDDMRAKEKMQWVKAYKAWMAARDDAERAQIEQQMAFAAQDFSARWKKDIESKYTILRSMLDTKQLEEVKKLGKRSTGTAD